MIRYMQQYTHDMELLTIREVAELLRVSPITVRRRIADGQLKAVRVGKGIRVPREAIEGFLTPAFREYSDEEIDRFLEEDRLSPALADRVNAYLARTDNEALRRNQARGYFLSNLYDPNHEKMTPEEQERARLAMERARKGREKLLAERGGRLFPNSAEVLHELREQRSRDLS